VGAAIEADVGERRRPDVAGAQRAGAARDEVGDPLLRLDALVEVLVSRERDRHAVREENRFERGAEPSRGRA